MEKNNSRKRIGTVFAIIISMVITELLPQNILVAKKTTAAETNYKSPGAEIITDGEITVTSSQAITITSSGNLKDYQILFDSGNGTKESPYQIATSEQLKAFLETIYNSDTGYNNKNYELTTDISMKDINLKYNDTYSFNGEFNGKGHSISNLTASSLFPHTYGATIKNLTLKSSNISGKEYVGGIVGFSEGRLTIDNCTVDNTTTITGLAQNLTYPYDDACDAIYIGGICGYAETAEISNCKNSAALSKECDTWRVPLMSSDAYGFFGEVWIGGIAGRCKYITNSVNDADLNIINNDNLSRWACGGINAGGIAGRADIVHGCNNEGNITVSGLGTSRICRNNIGGIIGGYLSEFRYRDDASVEDSMYDFLDENILHEITDCVNNGKINVINNEHEEGEPYSVGGIAGNLELESNVKKCINNGDIITSNIYGTGGIAGQIAGAEVITIENCTNNGNITGENNTGGIAGMCTGNGWYEYDYASMSYYDLTSGKMQYGYDKIINCENNGIITGTINVGGISGCSDNIVLEKCYNNANVVLKDSENVSYAGGITGIGNQVSFCENSGEISGTVSNINNNIEKNIGGIAGGGIVYASTNKGNITGNNINNAGGIIGTGSAITSINSGSVKNSLSTGGIAGTSEFIYRCCNTGTINGQKNTGGIAGIADGILLQSYTYGTVEGNSENIGTGVGFAKNLEGKNCFALKQETYKVIGNNYNCTAISEKTPEELKSKDVLKMLNESEKTKQDVYCFSNWSIDDASNNGYPFLWTTGRIRNDECYREIEVYSEYPVYYTYLPLLDKEYVVNSNELKEAVKKDNYYYIDYSCCKTEQSYCLALTNELKNYNVQGFSNQRGTRVLVKRHNEETFNETRKKEITEKVYTCKGSDFNCIFNLKSYPAKYTSKISGLRFDYNWDDNSDATGMDLINKLSYNYFGVHYNNRGNILTARRINKRINIPYYGKFTHFLWKEDGREEWYDQSELTVKRLKDYAKQGTILKMRFRLEYTVGFAIIDYDDIGENTMGTFYGNEIKVKLTKKQKKTPKIKVNLSKMNINIKNGMQYSYDLEKWNTVFPYKKAGKIYTDIPEAFQDIYTSGYYEGYKEGRGTNSCGYTCKRVNSIPLSYFDSSKRIIYVRSIGENILPSEPCTLTLPGQKTLGPTATFAQDERGKFLISDIIQGTGDTTSNAKYEYCIVDQNLQTYVKENGVNVKWKDLTDKTALDQKSNTVYTWSRFEWIDISTDNYYKEYIRRNVKNQKTCMLGYVKLKRTKEQLEQTYSASYVVIRRKADIASGTGASCSSYYYYDKKNKTFNLVTQKGEY